MLIIDNALVAELLSIEDCIDIQEQAFCAIPSGNAAYRPRLDMYAPCERDDGDYCWGTMEGVFDGIFAIRMKSDVITWPRDASGRWSKDKYCVEQGTHCGLVALFSIRNGEPLAVINDGVIQHVRVGGGAGIGVCHLSRSDSCVVGLLGSGGMAHTYLEAFCAVRRIESVKVYSPTPANRERFTEEMGGELGVEVVPVDSAREAVRGVDILASATDSMEPTFEADWLEPGMHVTNLGPDEISRAALERLDIRIRQGTPGIEVKEGTRQKSGVGYSPMAFIAGTDDEMRRLPLQSRGRSNFRMAYPDYCDLVAGTEFRNRNHLLPECRQPGPPVRRGRRPCLSQGARRRARPDDSHRVVPTGHSRLSRRDQEEMESQDLDAMLGAAARPPAKPDRGRIAP